MMKIENDCLDCPIPCTDCGRKRTPHYYCDECGAEETLYVYDGKELCKDCLAKKFEVVEGSN